MTISAISQTNSTVFTGLGTQTYEVPTTSLYTCNITCFLPWLSPDAPTARANPPTAEIQTVTMVADVSGSLNNTYWTFNTAGNAAGFYVWNNINGAGTDPAVAGRTGIEVSNATNATAATLAASSAAAVNAALAPAALSPSTLSPTFLTATAAGAVVTLTNAQVGAEAAAANGTASPGFSYSVTTTGTYGYQSGLVITVSHGTTVELILANPTGSQATLSGATTFAATAGDTITMTLTSLAAVDQAPNAVKGICDIYPGPAA